MPRKEWLASLTDEQREAFRAKVREQARVRMEDPAVRERARERSRKYEEHRKPRDPEQTAASDKRKYANYYAKNAPARRASSQAYREANTEKVRAYQREYQQSERGREVARRNAKAYRERNPNLSRIRAWRQRGARSDAYEWVAILLNDPCCYCGEPMQEIDHITAVTADGSGDWSNLTAACQPCNRSKKNHSLLGWLAKAAANSRGNQTCQLV